MNPKQHAFRPALSRREWLRRSGMGLGAIALGTLLAEEAAALEQTAAKPQFPARAKRVVHVFLEGGPSHLDTFDPKPTLVVKQGTVIPFPDDANRTGTAFGSPFKFVKRGKSGLELSEALPELGKVVDELCVIRSMQTDDPGHEQAMMMLNCGNTRFSRPSVGSWVTYGLGSANKNLPGYVALYNGGFPLKGAENWQSAFLPSSYQGTPLDASRLEPEKLIEHLRSPFASEEEQRLQLDLLGKMNRAHASKGRADDLRLEGRIESFELAYRMQSEAPEAFDLARESRSVRESYGDTAVGRQCLLARRLLERGVRFVQVFNGGWDNHENLEESLRNTAGETDRAVAGLIADLKRRGLLEDTLVLICGEFGRTPVADGNPTSVGKKPGRDHNNAGFSCVLAGGGVKGGIVHGSTDEFGFAAAENPVHVHDLHATILRQLGFDHEKLTYRYAGRDFRLTDVHGKVVESILR